MTDQPKINYLMYGSPMPTSMGRCADLYHDVRELRLAMEKEVEVVKQREVELMDHLVSNLSKGDDTGAAGMRYRAQVVVKPKPQIITRDDDGVPRDGWGLLCAWVRKNDRFDVFQRRLSDTAVMEWNEAEGRVMPGTRVVQVPTLSVVKL